MTRRSLSRIRGVSKSSAMANSGETTLPYLPEDIILVILYRLPVRSLLRFRCVCKSWRSAISSTDFAKSHLEMSVRSPNLKTGLLIVSSSYVKSINPHELSPPFITTELYHEPGNPDVYIYVLGSCNGLVCLHVDGSDCIIIYNPSTRHYKLIQLSDPFSHLGTRHYVCLGFGFGSELNEYKVVRMKSFLRPRTDTKFELEVHSIKDNAHQPPTVIKPSGDFAKGYIDSTLYFGGSFHFLVRPHNSFQLQRKAVIVRLDVAREVFDEVPEPDVCNASNRRNKLKVVGGCLSLVSSPLQSDLIDDFIDLWVMKEYGVKTSWTKLLSIPFSKSYEFVMPLNFKSHREILLAGINDDGGRDLLIFNSEENSFEKVFTDSNPRVHAAVYMESLISP